MPLISPAQSAFTIKKESDIIYFQKGNKTDSITKTKGSEFYFIVPENKKSKIVIQIENGHFTGTENDSIIKLHYMPGLKYECVYELKDEHAPVPHFEFKTLMNGTSTTNDSAIQIKIFQNYALFTENKYYFSTSSKQ
ncbi:MAG: hypothetical protein IPM51_14570 [Sphingobacteriaceae bacterium]|nr:hypothetical protein [Sphingobacteriaceae bacterium]